MKSWERNNLEGSVTCREVSHYQDEALSGDHSLLFGRAWDGAGSSHILWAGSSQSALWSAEIGLSEWPAPRCEAHPCRLGTHFWAPLCRSMWKDPPGNQLFLVPLACSSPIAPLTPNIWRQLHKWDIPTGRVHLIQGRPVLLSPPWAPFFLSFPFPPVNTRV